jgi:hypothetical protein
LVLAFLPDAGTYPEAEREGRVSAPGAPLTDDALCAAVTDAMVTFHQRYYHAVFSDHHVGPDIEIELFILAPTEPPLDGTAPDAA